MRAQFLMLRALGEAYSKRADAAESTGTGTMFRNHAIAHFDAADSLEAQHREIIARCATAPAGAPTETPDEEGAGS